MGTDDELTSKGGKKGDQGAASRAFTSDGRPTLTDLSLVFSAPVEGPGTHVLLVGIGTYDHLVDGDEEDLDVADGMHQLDAPPISVKALADWMLDGNFRNEQRPLASVALVVSGPEPFDYAHPNRNVGAGPVPNGTIDTVVTAIRRWLDRAKAQPDCQTIFYFCGHGIFSGSQVLLCRDYGAVAEDRFDGALNFSRLCGAMQTKRPQYQVFLADACRTPDEVVNLLAPIAEPGRSALSISSLAPRGGRPAKQSIHFASSDLAPSYGRVGGISVFAEALLMALRGGGAQLDLDMWIGTNGLQTALGAYTSRLASAEDVEQEPDRIKSDRFGIHKPERIEIPVFLSCDPTDAWQCRFSVSSERGGAEIRVDEHDPAEHPDRKTFEIMLEPDAYRFSAVFGEDTPFTGGFKSLVVFPPEAPACLPIERRPA